MQLFSHVIDPHSSVSMTNQILEILRREIQAGRWQNGERLPTAREISRLTGISPATASKALYILAVNGEVDRQVGRGSFLRTSKARRKRSGVIAVVPGGSWTPGSTISPTWPFIHYLIEQIDLELSQREYRSELFHRHSVQSLKACDGVINIGAISPELLKSARVENIPVVCLGTSDTPEGVPYVAADDRHEMWAAVDRLAEAGHRKIGLVSTFPGKLTRQIQLRLDAFVAACSQANISVHKDWIRNLEYNAAGHYAVVRRLLSAKDRPSAVICAYMPAAKAVYEVAEILGLNIPKDLSVIGLSPLPEEGENYRPALTTLVANLSGQARQAVQLIIEMVKTATPPLSEGYLVRSLWTPRASVAAPEKEKVRKK